ncbi:DUF6415 family natural product biosynthesis protein [Streptomyces sp. NPDC059894]|uniref:DUF6415 family natural product biosynthesis protein n=1 Tax=unclassified Streptomyces TaxID=2593676 RepID=UPI00365F828A
MRAAATWFLVQETLPRHQTVKLFGEDFSTHLEQLIPRIEQLTDGRAEGDAQARAAQAEVGEARRLLRVPERPGLNGEVERVKQLARSVVGLRDHYDALAGVTVCPACDQAIEDSDGSPPYGQVLSARKRIQRCCADRRLRLSC